MSVSLGSTNIKEICLGNTKIKEAYLGSTKVFGGEEKPEEYLKISYDHGPGAVVPDYRIKTEYIDINNSNNIVESSNGPIIIPSDFIGEETPMPTVYVTMCDKNSGQYFDQYPIYPEYSYDKINWTHFGSTSYIPLQYGESLYIRSYKPIGAGLDANAICISTRTYDFETIYNKTDTYGNTVRCYRCTSYGYRRTSGGSFEHDYPLVSISGNLQAIIDYQNPDTLDYNSSYMFRYCGRFLYDVSKLVFPWESLEGYDTNGIFKGLFYGCKFITTAPELPATTLVNECYREMFFGCTSLTTPPELPAMELKEYCYYQMFQSCTSLTIAPELPATTLANYCYAGMFRSCAFTTAPELPAMEMKQNCYYAMFQNCTSLTIAPELHSVKLANNCYSYMFKDCTSLTTPPDVLPATSLGSGCYTYMFYNCTSITEAPDILSLNIDTEAPAFTSMFEGCSSLNSIRIAYMGYFDGSNDFNNWVNGVASSGRLFYDGPDTTTGVSAIPTGWTKTPNYLTITALKYFILRIAKVGSKCINTIKYSYDLETWNELNLNQYSGIMLQTGNKLYLWNNSDVFSSGENNNSIRIFPDGINGQTEDVCKYSGNIFSLIDFNTKTYDGCFQDLFRCEDCNAQGTYLYANQKGVKKINIAIPNISISTYPSLFLGTYRKLCAYNKNIKHPVSIDEQISLTSYIFTEMFSYCENLISAPNLSATTLYEGCYSNMFDGCSNLVKAPYLPATTLSEFCYGNMFKSCTKLKEIKLAYTGNFESTYSFLDWVSGVAFTGDFYYNGSDTTRGPSAIPTGWTIHTF